jgi:hypothetical protein
MFLKEANHNTGVMGWTWDVALAITITFMMCFINSGWGRVLALRKHAVIAIASHCSPLLCHTHKQLLYK